MKRKITIALVILTAVALEVVILTQIPDRIIKMQVTAYCPCKKCCGRKARGLTSIGKDANQPGVAADPKLLPYGTLLKIPGVGRRVVDDTGGKMRQDAKKGIYHIDIRFWGPEAHEKARTFGVRKLTVWVWFP